MIRVYILDDHPVVLEGLASALQKDPSIELIGVSQSSAECLDWFENNTCDVLLVDIEIDHLDGIQVCEQVIKLQPSLGVIGLTSYDSLSFINAMVHKGARGYLFKNTDLDELTEAIKTVAKGGEYFSKEVYQKLLHKRKTNSRSSYVPTLTRRETEILKLIYDGLSNQEMADQLFISLSTVETHRTNLYAKIDAKNTASLIKAAIKFGLLDAY